MNDLTFEAYTWLTELNEVKSAEIISESTIENEYTDTFFALTGDKFWNVYNIQILIVDKYFKHMKKGRVRRREKVN
ncbi:hypothetical protein [Flammeovirga sp. EKP202]|uniref:hypothetical protein n=1 Tax=Flammeovirga sp. EKP202 TaxID=2770592 RepID=UPI00165FBD08|nr:hypothetical protein [Flammeovirga sp. EKP202]MBD0404939.1 hypothetical protein [Flammeovirga sp. EKP202]